MKPTGTQKEVAKSVPKKRERWKWNDESKEALALLREFVATGKPLPKKVTANFSYAINKILDFYQFWMLKRVLSDQKSNSIQKHLIRVLSRTTAHKNIKQRFKQAQQDGIRASFDCVVQATLVSRGQMVSDELNLAVLKRGFVEDPDEIVRDPQALEMFVEATKKEHSKFLFDLAADMKNHDERGNKTKVNGLLAEIARHWTDCHAPMWLMSRKAILKASKALSGGSLESIIWNDESLKRVFRESSLSPSDDTPIVDVKVKAGGIIGFVVESQIFDLLGAPDSNSDRRQPLQISFRASGSNEIISYLIIREGVAQRKTVHRIAPRGGKESK
jgi:hypothetical protein